MSSASKAITIRRVGKEAADLLSAIHKECFPTYWNLESFNDFFSIDNTIALLVEIDKPIAMMVYRVAHEQADIITLCVLPEGRRRGIAAALLQKAVLHMASLGAERLFLDVEDGNLAAQTLYEKHGFTVINRRKNYYRQKDGTCTDALVMARELA